MAAVRASLELYSDVGGKEAGARDSFTLRGCNFLQNDEDGKFNWAEQ